MDVARGGETCSTQSYKGISGDPGLENQAPKNLCSGHEAEKPGRQGIALGLRHRAGRTLFGGRRLPGAVEYLGGRLDGAHRMAVRALGPLDRQQRRGSVPVALPAMTGQNVVT